MFYVFIYTLWLKRRHYYNIVIGGAAGATAPLIASAAWSGSISVYAWVLFAIVWFGPFPHFWALALKSEFERVKIPMLPNVLGDARTRVEIWIYTLILLPLSAVPFFISGASWIYILGVTLAWIWYLRETIIRMKQKTKPAYKKLFYVSIGYLF